MFFSSEPEALRAFLRDRLGFSSHTDVGGGWLIFDLPEADMGVHPSDERGEHGQPAGTHDVSFYCEDLRGHDRGARRARRSIRRRSGRCRVRPDDPFQDAGRRARAALSTPLPQGRRLSRAEHRPGLPEEAFEPGAIPPRQPSSEMATGQGRITKNVSTPTSFVI